MSCGLDLNENCLSVQVQSNRTILKPYLKTSLFSIQVQCALENGLIFALELAWCLVNISIIAAGTARQHLFLVVLSCFHMNCSFLRRASMH